MIGVTRPETADGDRVSGGGVAVKVKPTFAATESIALLDVARATKYLAPIFNPLGTVKVTVVLFTRVAGMAFDELVPKSSKYASMLPESSWKSVPVTVTTVPAGPDEGDIPVMACAFAADAGSNAAINTKRQANIAACTRPKIFTEIPIT